MWQIFDILSGIVMLVWSWTAFIGYILRVFGHEVPAILKHIFFELKPFYLPAATYSVIYAILTVEYKDFWFYLLAAANYFTYWFWKDKFGDDDRWKKRMERAGEVVKRVGSKLVVEAVPEGA